MPTLPPLFVSHGSPMFALEAGSTGPALHAWAASLPRPRAVLIMSPHWMAATARVMAAPAPATYHDFGGFPAPLYALQYPAAGDPALAQDVAQRLAAAGLPSALDAQRPLDHGAWVPLLHMFPAADVPVVQLALPSQAGPLEVLRLGQALAGLRTQGVLIIGSGSMTHNLAEFFGGQHTPAPYVERFSRWIEQALQQGDTAALLDYRRQAPQAARAHPSEDHFLPLFFALGAADPQARPHYLSREIMYGMLAMDAFCLPDAGPAAQH